MGRPSASLKIVGGSPSRVVPWQEMERRVAERIAAKAADRAAGRSSIPPWKQHASASASGSISQSSGSSSIGSLSTAISESLFNDLEEKAPDSGVRASEPRIATFTPSKASSVVDASLSFTVYSVEDLNVRQRHSAPPSAPPPPPSRWPDVWRSSKSLLKVWWSWRQTPKPRTRMMDVCGVPVATLKADLFAALKQLPWRKIIVRSAIFLTSFLFLLFVVLTAAEMTDDLKPGAPRQLGTRQAETPAAAGSSKVAAPAPPSVEPEAPAIEIEDTTPPPAAKKAVPVKKPVAAKKKKTGKDVFNP